MDVLSQHLASSSQWMARRSEVEQFLLLHIIEGLRMLVEARSIPSEFTWRISDILLAAVGSSVNPDRVPNDIDLVIAFDLDCQKGPWSPDVSSMIASFVYSIIGVGVKALNKSGAATPGISISGRGDGPIHGGKNSSIYGTAVIEVGGCLPIHLIVLDFNKPTGWVEDENNAPPSSALLFWSGADFRVSWPENRDLSDKESLVVIKELSEAAHRMVLSAPENLVYGTVED